MATNEKMDQAIQRVIQRADPAPSRERGRIRGTRGRGRARGVGRGQRGGAVENEATNGDCDADGADQEDGDAGETE